MADVILSAFLDEGRSERSVPDIFEQMDVGQALGLKYYTPRMIKFEGAAEIVNVAKLPYNRIDTLVNIHDHHGFQVATLGTAIGKTLLLDVEDGSNNTYEDSSETMENLERAIEIGHRLIPEGVVPIRAFSFYVPKGETPSDYVGQSVERLGPMVELCAKKGAIYGIEVEAGGLVGHNAATLMAIREELGSPDALGLVYDGANLVVQSNSIHAIMEYQAMAEGVAWMHIKDYQKGAPTLEDGVEREDMLTHFVPADSGSVDHACLMANLKGDLERYAARFQQLGLPGYILDLEPHLKGGGQFGGYSGPDGMGVALRALTRTLEKAGIEYALRDMDSVQAQRGE